MTKLLEQGIKAVLNLPDDRQNAAGELLLTLAAQGTLPRYRPSPEQIEGILEALVEADRGEFVSDGDMADFWRRCGL